MEIDSIIETHYRVSRGFLVGYGSRGTPNYCLVGTDTKGNTCLIHFPNISNVHLVFCLNLLELGKLGLQCCRSDILKPESINPYAYPGVDLWMSVQEARDPVVPQSNSTTRNLADQNSHFSNLSMARCISF